MPILQTIADSCMFLNAFPASSVLCVHETLNLKDTNLVMISVAVPIKLDYIIQAWWSVQVLLTNWEKESRKFIILMVHNLLTWGNGATVFRLQENKGRKTTDE